MAFALSHTQKNHLENLTALKEYGLAYQYCSEIIDHAVKNGDISQGMQRWFDWAAQINDNPESLTRAYAETFSKMSASNDAKTLTTKDFQRASDYIAMQVLAHILENGIPLNAKDIVTEDIKQGSIEMDTAPVDFPGTLVAYALFGVDAEGEMISDNPDLSFKEKIFVSVEQYSKHALITTGTALYLGIEGAKDVIATPSRIADVPQAIHDINTYEPAADTVKAIMMGAEYDPHGHLDTVAKAIGHRTAEAADDTMTMIIESPVTQPTTQLFTMALRDTFNALRGDLSHLYPIENPAFAQEEIKPILTADQVYNMLPDDRETFSTVFVQDNAETSPTLSLLADAKYNDLDFNDFYNNLDLSSIDVDALLTTLTDGAQAAADYTEQSLQDNNNAHSVIFTHDNEAGQIGISSGGR